MRPDPPIDLFPWILGTLLIAMAIPAGVAFMAETPRISHVASVAPGLPVPAPNAPEVSSPLPNVLRAAAPASPATPAAQQIWQCSKDGQKTFSDSPCGADATVHRLSPVNRMAAAPGASSGGYPAYVTSTDDAGGYDDTGSDVDASTPTGQTFVLGVLNRREHRHPSHPDARSVRVAPGMPSPARRSPANLRR